MKNPTPILFQHWRHCIITPISLNLCLATNHRLRSRLSRLCNHVPGHVTGKHICIGDWKSYVTMITTHLRYKLASTGPKISFWCLFNPLNVFIILCLFTWCQVVCITFVFPEKNKFKCKWAFMTICFECNHRNVQPVWMLMQLYLRKKKLLYLLLILLTAGLGSVCFCVEWNS